jgi:two-component sensor histidine kinase
MPHPKVKYTIDAGDTFLSLNACVPLGLVLNEIITNSMKHAFRNVDQPEINVSLHTQDENLVVEVADNGSGLASDFDFSAPDTFGFRIIKLLVEQMRGQIAISNTIGTAFTINVPIEE